VITWAASKVAISTALPTSGSANTTFPQLEQPVLWTPDPWLHLSHLCKYLVVYTKGIKWTNDTDSYITTKCQEKNAICNRASDQCCWATHPLCSALPSDKKILSVQGLFQRCVKLYSYSDKRPSTKHINKALIIFKS
jgi:hypothetical protein